MIKGKLVVHAFTQEIDQQSLNRDLNDLVFHKTNDLIYKGNYTKIYKVID